MHPALKKAGAAFILSAGTLWGVMGIFVRRLNAAGLDSMQVVFVRSVVTVLFMVVFLLFYNRKLLKIHFRDLWCFLGTGLVSILMFTYCYFRTMQTTSLSVAAVLLYTAPIMVTIMSVPLFKEKLTVSKVAACVLAFTGCIFVTGLLGNAQAVSASGILTGLLSGFGYALYSIFGRFALNRGYHSFTITVYTFIVASAGVIPFLDFHAFSSAFQRDSSILPTSILMGIVTAAIPYSLYTFGLTVVESSRASIMASVEPVVATLVGTLVFHETLTFYGVIGMILVLSAIVLLNFHPIQATASKPDTAHTQKPD